MCISDDWFYQSIYSCILSPQTHCQKFTAKITTIDPHFKTLDPHLTKGLSAFSRRLGKNPFLGQIDSLHFLRNIHYLVEEGSNYNRRSKTFFFLFGLNSTSFHNKLNGKWSATFKTSSENVKLVGSGLVSQASGIVGRVTKLSFPFLAPRRLHTK